MRTASRIQSDTQASSPGPLGPVIAAKSFIRKHMPSLPHFASASRALGPHHSVLSICDLLEG